MPGYIGNDPAGSATKIARQTYTTSGAATTDFTFTSGYDVGYLDLYIDGVRQTKGTNFTASDGSTFRVLNGGVGTGSTVEAIAYKTFNLATVDFDDLGNTGNLTLSGDISAVDATFSGDVSIGGTLTYEDVTNIDSVGIITARAGVKVPDNQKVFLGTGDDLQIFHNASHSIINNSTGDLRIESDRLELLNNASNEFLLTADANGSVDLYHNGNKKFETTSSGAIVTGIATVITTTAADSSNVYNFVVRGDDSGTDDESAQIFLGAINGTNRGTAIAAQRQSSSNNHDLIFKTSAAGAVPTERVRIDSSGRVGIGTDSPLDELHVNSSSTNVNLRLTRDLNTGARITGSDGASPAFIVETIASGTATERLRINSSGNVDINGAPPWTVTGGDYRNLSISGEGASASGFLWLGNGAAATNADFDLGRVNFVNGTNIVAQIKGTTQTSANDDGRISFFTKATGSSIAEALRIDSSGRLLLGTTTEGEGSADNLTIADSGNCGITLRSGTGNSGGIYFSDATSGGGEYDGLIAYHQGNRFLQFWTAQTERMCIDSSGRLLVGSVSALDTTAGAITSNNSSSGGRLALGGNPSSAGSSIGEVFGWWNGNKVAGLVITSGADTTNKDDGELLFYTSASGPNVQERLRIDRVGNVGIGEASPAHELHVSDASTPEIVAEDTSNNCKAYLGSSDTNGRVGTLSNHDFAFRTNDTEVMRLDSSGRLLVGVTATFGGNNEMLQIARSGGGAIALLRNDTSVSTGNELGAISWYGNDSTSSTYQECVTIRAFADDNHGDGDKPTRLVFSTTADGASSPTERMRINNAGQTSIFRSGASGQLQLGTLDGSTFSSHENYMIVYGSAANNYVLNRACNVADGTPSFEIVLGGTRRIEIEADGDIYNVNGTYGTISDARLKENIVDASSQWDDIKDLQVRNFNFTVDSGLPTNTQIGFVAQEVEQVSPGLVKTNLDEDKDGNDLGTTTKTVKTSVLLVKAVKALQESMDRIETLEAKVAALEG